MRPACTALTRWSLRRLPVVALSAVLSSISWSLLICFTSPLVSRPCDWVSNEFPFSVESVICLAVVEVEDWRFKLKFCILELMIGDWVEFCEVCEVNGVVDEVNAVVFVTGVIDVPDVVSGSSLVDEVNVVVLVTDVEVLNVVVKVNGFSFVVAVEVWINSSLLLSKVGVIIEVISCLMIVLYWIFNASKVGSETWAFATFDFVGRVINSVVCCWSLTALIDRWSRRFVESVGKFLKTFGMVVASLWPSSWTSTGSWVTLSELVKESPRVMNILAGSVVTSFTFIFLKIWSFSNNGMARAMSVSWSGTN